MVVCIYAFTMHKAARLRHARQAPHHRSHLSATHVVRPAHAGDVAAIHSLVRRYAAKGALLPRTRRDIRATIGDYVVVVDVHRRVVGCAALSVYSASLAEVSSVAVARSAQGKGLGTMAVRGTEALARDRGIIELFAMTTARRFSSRSVTSGRQSSSIPRSSRATSSSVPLVSTSVERSCYRKLPHLD